MVKAEKKKKNLKNIKSSEDVDELELSSFAGGVRIGRTFWKTT